MVFTDEFIADESQIRSVLDYAVEIRELPQHQQNYVAITGINQVNMDGYNQAAFVVSSFSSRLIFV